MADQVEDVLAGWGDEVKSVVATPVPSIPSIPAHETTDVLAGWGDESPSQDTKGVVVLRAHELTSPEIPSETLDKERKRKQMLETTAHDILAPDSLIKKAGQVILSPVLGLADLVSRTIYAKNAALDEAIRTAKALGLDTTDVAHKLSDDPDITTEQQDASGGSVSAASRRNLWAIFKDASLKEKAGMALAAGLGLSATKDRMKVAAGREIFSGIGSIKGEKMDLAAVVEKHFPDIPKGIIEGPNENLSDAIPGMYSETGSGLKFKKGGFFDPTALGTALFAIDQATDPLTYLSFGGAGGARILLKNGTAKYLTKTGVARRLEMVGEHLGPDVFREGNDLITSQLSSHVRQSVQEIHGVENKLPEIISSTEHSDLFNTARDAAYKFADEHMEVLINGKKGNRYAHGFGIDLRVPDAELIHLADWDQIKTPLIGLQTFVANTGRALTPVMAEKIGRSLEVLNEGMRNLGVKYFGGSIINNPYIKMNKDSILESAAYRVAKGQDKIEAAHVRLLNATTQIEVDAAEAEIKSLLDAARKEMEHGGGKLNPIYNTGLKQDDDTIREALRRMTEDPAVKAKLAAGDFDVVYNAVYHPELIDETHVQELVRITGELVDTKVLPKKFRFEWEAVPGLGMDKRSYQAYLYEAAKNRFGRFLGKEFGDKFDKNTLDRAMAEWTATPLSDMSTIDRATFGFKTKQAIDGVLKQIGGDATKMRAFIDDPAGHLDAFLREPNRGLYTASKNRVEEAFLNTPTQLARKAKIREDLSRHAWEMPLEKRKALRGELSRKGEHVIYPEETTGALAGLETPNKFEFGKPYTLHTPTEGSKEMLQKAIFERMLHRAYFNTPEWGKVLDILDRNPELRNVVRPRLGAAPGALGNVELTDILASGRRFQVPKDVASAYDKFTPSVLRSKETHNILRVWDAYTNTWKYMQTQPWISFGMRNAYQNSMIQYLRNGVATLDPIRRAKSIAVAALAGEVPTRVGKYGFDMERLGSVSIKLGDNTYRLSDIAQQLRSQGVLQTTAETVEATGRGLTKRSTAAAASRARDFAKKQHGLTALAADDLLEAELARETALYNEAKRLITEKLLPGVKTVGSVPAHFGRVLDNFERINTYMNSLARGMSPAQAAKEVKDLLVDYSRISKFERDVFRRTVPFYGFMRLAVPQWTAEILKEPGRAETFASLIREDASNRKGGNDSDFMASYRLNGRRIRLNSDGKTLTVIEGLETPFSVISPLDPIFQDKSLTAGFLRSMVGVSHPLIQAAITGVTGVDPRTGLSTSRKPSELLGRAIHSITGDRETDAKFGIVLENGKYVATPRSIQMMNLLTIGRAVREMDAILHAAEKDPEYGKAWSVWLQAIFNPKSVGGFDYKTLDIEKEKIQQLRQFNRSLQQIVDDYDPGKPGQRKPVK